MATDLLAFIHELAVYLSEDQAMRSIALEMGNRDAKQWAKLRGLTPVRGWPSVEETETALREWILGGTALAAANALLAEAADEAKRLQDRIDELEGALRRAGGDS